jgi:hypothetical protein
MKQNGTARSHFHLRRVAGLFEGLAAVQELLFQRIALFNRLGKDWLRNFVQTKIERIEQNEAEVAEKTGKHFAEGAAVGFFRAVTFADNSRSRCRFRR